MEKFKMVLVFQAAIFFLVGAFFWLSKRRKENTFQENLSEITVEDAGDAMRSYPNDNEPDSLAWIIEACIVMGVYTVVCLVTDLVWGIYLLFQYLCSDSRL